MFPHSMKILFGAVLVSLGISFFAFAVDAEHQSDMPARPASHAEANASPQHAETYLRRG